MDDDERTIRELDAAWSRALEAKDVNQVMSFYAEDAVFLAPGGPMIKDAVQLRERWARAFSLPGYALSFDPVSVEVSKSRDLACDISTFRLTLMDERGNPVTRVGKALTVWQKRAGHWKVVAEAPNYDN